MREGWEYKKLGECFTYIKNGANIKQKKDVDGYPITRIETLSGGVFNRDRVGYAGIHDLSKYENYILESKDLLMSHINSKAYIGRTVEYKSDNKETIIHGMNLLRLKANLNIIDSTFFAYYTQSGDFKSKIARIRKDAVNQSSFAISDLKRFNIPLPPKSTQLAIVSELDKINELIRLKKEQLKDFDNLAQSIFYEMFGDPVENEMGWEVKKLGEFANFKNGLNFSKSTNGCLIRFLGVSDFQNRKQISSNELEHITLSESISEDYLLKTGDIVFVRSNGNKELIGRSVKLNITEPTTYSGFCIRCRIITDVIDKEFVAFILKTPAVHQLMTNSGRGCNISNLNQKNLNSIPIICPPYNLQHLFAQRIEQIEHQKAEVQKVIADLETLLASRMQYWFE